MQSFTCTALLGNSPRGLRVFTHPAITVSGRLFHAVTLTVHLPYRRSLNPGKTSPPGLGCSAFARHYLRNHVRFLFLGLLRCFTSPRLASPDYEFIQSIILSYQDWVFPLGDPRISACYAAPRGLSQPATSFIASWHQGIHRLHLVA